MIDKIIGELNSLDATEDAPATKYTIEADDVNIWIEFECEDGRQGVVQVYVDGPDNTKEADSIHAEINYDAGDDDGEGASYTMTEEEI